MALTLQNVIDATRNLLSDNVNFTAISPDSRVGNSYTDAQVTEGVNFAIKEYCRAKPYATYTETTPATPTAAKLTVPLDSLGVLSVKYNGISLSKSTLAFERMMSATFDSDTATAQSGQMNAAPRRWYEKDKTTIVLAPAIGSWGAYGVICYTQMPTLLDVASPSTTVDTRILTTHQEFLKYATAAYLLQMENDKQNMELSLQFFNEFKQLIGAA